MKNSIVNIESVSNNSFGTGFVIDNDEKGVYILTCQHVLDDVETPVVESVLAKVIAKGEFIDMAVLFVSKLQLTALHLQPENNKNLDVEVIGFSTFNKTLTQKKHIKATLYEESIELHSKEDDAFYNVRKIKANDGFNFDRGNSGSPVICKSSGAVIAMISNKEGSDLAYAINIENLKTVWKDVPHKLFDNTTPKPTRKPHPQPEFTSDKKPSSSFMKYIITLLIVLALGFGVYSLMKPTHPKKLPLNTPTTINDVATLKKMASKALDSQNYSSASNILNRIYNLNPKSYTLKFNQDDALSKLGNIKKAYFSSIRLIKKNSEMTLTYNVQKENWFVLSGYKKNKRIIFYKKQFFDNNMLRGYTLEYPTNEKTKYSKLIKGLNDIYPHSN